MNKNLVGGYYLVSLDGVDLASESEIVLTDVAKLLYYAKKYKFVVFQDIVIGGEKKTATPAMFEADMTLSTKPEDWDDETDGEFVPEELYTAKIYNLYGKNIAIDAEGVASVTDYTTEPKLDSLYGKFVRKVKAEDIPYPLTQEWIDIIVEGIFVEGTFRGAKNPLFFPAGTVGTSKQGWVLVVDQNRGSTSLQGYTIIADGTIGFGDAISLYSQGVDGIGKLKLGSFGTIDSNRLDLKTVAFLNGKSFPTYPTDQTDKTYVLKLVNGTLTWVEETA